VSLDALHAGLGWPAAAALLAVSASTSFITAAFGLGGGAVMLAVLATLLPAAAIIPVHGVVQLGSNLGRMAMMRPHLDRAALAPFLGGSLVGAALGGSLLVELPAAAIIPVHGVVQLGSNLGRMAMMRPHLDRAALAPFLGGSLVGAALGGSLLVELPAAAIQIIVGLFILWSVAARPPAFLKRSGALAGAVSSFLTMFVGATGPFVATWLRSRGLDRMGQVATHATLMTAQHGLKLIVFGALGFAFGQWLPLVAGLIATGFLGTLLGRQVLLRIDERRFRLALNAVLVVLGARLVWEGARAQLG
jgi:uncharacterized membrane protein YfcA